MFPIYNILSIFIHRIVYLKKKKTNKQILQATFWEADSMAGHKMYLLGERQWKYK